jgi:hypothetical protein
MFILFCLKLLKGMLTSHYEKEIKHINALTTSIFQTQFCFFLVKVYNVCVS